MGLISKLLGGWSSPPSQLEAELAAIAKDGRMHARTRLHDETMATLTLPSGLVGRVVDVSYGGVAASFPALSFPLKASMQSDATLEILGHATMLRMTTIRVVSHLDHEVLVGFCLHHESAEGLLFLREFIEPSRCGESLGLINPSLRQSRYQGQEWHCWRGDGPTDLIAQSAAAADALNEAILTFRLNKTYCEVTLKQGHLKTGLVRQEEEAGLLNGSARTTAGSPADDLRVLRAGLYIMMASPPACRTLCAPVITLAREQLSVLTRAAVEAKKA